jgi:hypothetical protein
LAKGCIGRLFKIKSGFKNNHFDNQHSGFQKRAKGHVLLELVYQHLELIEKDYFGLQFSDNGMPPTTENSDVMVRHCFRKCHLLCKLPEPAAQM